jgi:hypothetical protein
MASRAAEYPDLVHISTQKALRLRKPSSDVHVDAERLRLALEGKSSDGIGMSGADATSGWRSPDDVRHPGETDEGSWRTSAAAFIQDREPFMSSG